MENKNDQLDALQDIRQMMKKSSKFLSLSGLSGVFAGIYALIGAFAGMAVIDYYVKNSDYSKKAYNELLFICILICFGVLVLSIATALLFTLKKAKKSGQKLFDHTGLRLIINMLIPLITGGLFCTALLYQGNGTMILLVSPAMLIFYGLALVNASKYTLHDIRYLGCLQIALGIVASFYLGYGILFWALGFGVLHIIYGIIMWFKYERK